MTLGFWGAWCPHKREAGIWRREDGGQKQDRGESKCRWTGCEVEEGDSGSSRGWKGEDAASPWSLQKAQTLWAP